MTAMNGVIVKIADTCLGWLRIPAANGNETRA
jgi:hypothetical protein